MDGAERGLAEGYNSHVIRLVTEQPWKKEDVDIYGAGRNSEGYAVFLQYF